MKFLKRVGIKENKIKLIKNIEKIIISSPQYENHEWEVFSFLFETKDVKIKLNWENSEFKWIQIDEIQEL